MPDFLLSEGVFQEGAQRRCESAEAAVATAEQRAKDVAAEVAAAVAAADARGKVCHVLRSSCC